MFVPFIRLFLNLSVWFYFAFAGLARFIPWFTRIGLTSLGVGVVTYTGMHALVDVVIARINSQMGGLPSELAALLNYMGVFTAVQIVTAAVSTRLSMSLINGAITRWRARPFVLKA